MKQIKRIGVLTSGGDCAGLNAVIRAVAHRAIWTYKWEVYGILDGTEGLTSRPLRYRKLEIEDFSGPLIRTGGTMLGTINSGDPFNRKMPDGSYRDLTADFAAGVKELELDAIVVIGGDGSMSIVSRLCHGANVPMVGIPKTIDNDAPLTEHSVGFATARDVCVDALDRLHATAASHSRVMILEVMGRDAGHIALHSAIAGGADVCIIPEVSYTLEGIIKKLKNVRNQGRKHALAVIAEGVKTRCGESVSVAHGESDIRYGGIGHYLSEKLKEMEPELQCRVTVLGHVQRGGIPSAFDRITASAFGVHAVDVLSKGKSDCMVGWRNSRVTEFPLSDVVARGAMNIEPETNAILKTAVGLGMYVGEGIKFKEDL
ncbi:MAG: ATP-dependent 6-phosphofructokinase [Alphaproteobacteria bacterium]